MIRRMLLLPLLAIAVVGITQARAAGSTSEEQELLKVEEARNDCLQKGDADGVAQYVAEDVTYGNERGVVLNKEQLLANIRSRKIHFVSFKHDDIKVQLHGNTGIITGRSTSVVENEGKLSTHPRRFMNVWEKQSDGKWLLEGHAEASIAEK